jgi:dipeptidyl aminopeptidase/acylaminoacyl peptidase
LTCASTLAAQAAPPSTDIFLAPLTISGVRFTVGTPINITARPGYDNQPSFTPDGRAILYTSVRDDGQSDIYRYDIAGKATTRVTSTPESEYSALVMPGGKRFSVIRVEKDSTQRLWSFDLNGGDPRLVLDSIKPVGYHTWVDSTTLALFVLGRPNALVVANTTTGRADTVARDIGRSLATPPGGTPGSGFTFAQRDQDSAWVVLLSERSPTGWQLRPLTPLPRGAEYAVFPAHDVVVTATGTTILIKPAPMAPWVQAADFSGAGFRTITRLAVSPDGKWLAFVAE